MITVDADTRSWIAGAADMSVVAEVYAPDAAPPFDPADAVRLFAPAAGITFAGESYTPLVKSFGSFNRSITPEVNTASLELDNLSREAGRFEFSDGFEGHILVIRWISRSRSTSLSRSVILWAGRLKSPTTGSRASLPLEARFVVGSVDVLAPRRKYAVDDPEGRFPTDPLFEGFRFMPQYGTSTYSARVRRGGLLGLLGFKKTVTRTLQYSSYSDLDQEQPVPDVFGRAQLAGTHIGYADAGTEIKMTTAFCEGEIEAFHSLRAVDTRFYLVGSVSYRYGLPGGTGTQTAYTDAAWPSNGIYSKTALVFAKYGGTDVADVDAAPALVAIILGKKVTVPDGTGDWAADAWSDNGAAVVRHLLTSDDYFRLGEDWVDDESFLEVHRYNDEVIFDYSYTDVLFIPEASAFTSGTYEGAEYAGTSLVTTDWFKYLAEDANASDAFLKPPVQLGYETTDTITGLTDTPPPDDGPLPGGGTTGTASYLTYFLRRRYTCNLAVTDQGPLLDLLNETVMPGSRMFLVQEADGKVGLRSKRPADFAYTTASASAGATQLSLDDAAPFLADNPAHLLVGVSEAGSETVAVTGGNYPSSQNSTTLTASAKITVTSFSGASGGSTPATATITPDELDTAHRYEVTLDGYLIGFNIGPGDTLETIAGFISASINAHPALSRRFRASWTPGDSEVTVTARFGVVTLGSALLAAHSGPLADPSSAPTLTASSGGTLPAGDYNVCYSWRNDRGQTLTSPIAGVTLTANQRISVSSLTLPSGATGVNWYVSPAAGSFRLRLQGTTLTGASFYIDSLPRLNDPIPPDFNRTGTEVMRVRAVFTDRAEPRSGSAPSNVLKASYSWKLGNREKPVNRIELKYRDSSQDFRLVTLRLSDSDHIAKVKQVNSESVDGTAIDNYHQAYRVAAGTLAEKRDADFFYQWKSDRLAGLLQEGDVVAITDDGAEVYNLPVRIEAVETTVEDGFPVFSFTARKYSQTLYDDSVADRTIPVVVEPSSGNDFV